MSKCILKTNINISATSITIKYINKIKLIRMGIETFEIHLSTLPPHLYHPGDTVAGYIRLVATPEVDLSEGITIILYGVASVEWVVRAGRVNNSYVGHDELFKTSFVQYATSEQIDYPFMMQIPNIPALPWTTTTEYGSVEYGIKAIIKRPWFKLGDKKVEVQFHMRSEVHDRLVPISRNQYYYANTIAEDTEDGNVGCCCIPFCCWYYCSDEKVKLTLKTESLWVYPGEELIYSLIVDNTLSKSEMGSAKIQLVGIWRHRGHFRNALGFHSENAIDENCLKKIYTEDVHVMTVSPGEHKITKGKLKIPSYLTPTQVECDVLKLTYRLKALLDEMSGFHCIGMSVEVDIDIIIGSRKHVIDAMSKDA